MSLENDSSQIEQDSQQMDEVKLQMFIMPEKFLPDDFLSLEAKQQTMILYNLFNGTIHDAFVQMNKYLKLIYNKLQEMQQQVNNINQRLIDIGQDIQRQNDRIQNIERNTTQINQILAKLQVLIQQRLNQQ